MPVYILLAATVVVDNSALLQKATEPVGNLWWETALPLLALVLAVISAVVAGISHASAKRRRIEHEVSAVVPKVLAKGLKELRKGSGCTPDTFLRKLDLTCDSPPHPGPGSYTTKEEAAAYKLATGLIDQHYYPGTFGADIANSRHASAAERGTTPKQLLDAILYARRWHIARGDELLGVRLRQDAYAILDDHFLDRSNREGASYSGVTSLFGLRVTTDAGLRSYFEIDYLPETTAVQRS